MITGGNILKPDIVNADYILYLGAYPGHSGKPMQAIGRQAAIRAAEGKLRFDVVDPVLAGGAVSPVGGQARWVPIKPTTDTAFAMALMRWMIENNRVDTDYLASPNLAAARAKGFNSWTNAAHLVVDDPSHPGHRRLLRAEDLGLPVPAAPQTPAPAPKPEHFVVIDKADGQPALHSASGAGDLLYSGTLTDAAGRQVKVKTAFVLLKESVLATDGKEYSKICGVPEATIAGIAAEFTAHGTRVGVDGMGNTAAANGFDIALALYLLPALTGSYNKKGGMITRRNSYKTFGPGPRYNLAAIAGGPQRKGVNIGRTGFAYEKTSEYKTKKERGENPYPSRLPWYSFGGASDNQFLFSAVNSYPYQAKILMVWMANPLMTSAAAGGRAVQDELGKVERVPLIIGIDAFMGETTALADYIVPDTTPYESWGIANTEGNCAGKVSSLRWPIVQPMTAKLGDGRFACFENYIIDAAKLIGLPGFGDNAIPGADKKLYPLNRPADYFLKAAANAAFDGTPVPGLSAREAGMQGLDEIAADWKNSVTAEEWPKVAYLISRGGRFEAYGEGFKRDDHNYPYTGCVNIYIERMATAKNSFTGKPYSGVIGYTPEAFADDTPVEQAFPPDKWPFKAVSYKAKFRSVSMLVNTSLRSLSKTNAIEINPADAAAQGLKDGQKVKLIAATGGEAVGLLKVRPGIARGTVAVAFGYGHWEYGARPYQVGGKKIGGDASRGTGVNLSAISLTDPKVKTVFGHSEMSTGTAGRNGGAFRIEKV